MITPRGAFARSRPTIILNRAPHTFRFVVFFLACFLVWSCVFIGTNHEKASTQSNPEPKPNPNPTNPTLNQAKSKPKAKPKAPTRKIWQKQKKMRTTSKTELQYIWFYTLSGTWHYLYLVRFSSGARTPPKGKQAVKLLWDHTFPGRKDQNAQAVFLPWQKAENENAEPCAQRRCLHLDDIFWESRHFRCFVR